jgi:Cu2+-exporting ATPase
MIADFRRRFWVSLVLTLPILVLSPTLQGWLGYELAFPGVMVVLAALATAIFLYGGWPFLTGLVDEIGERQPGMMTLIGLAITVAWAYSTAVALGLEGKVFFWELATLVDVMLVGHWIEMRSVLGASEAVSELAELMPSEARLVTSDGETREVQVSDLSAGDRVLIRPGERVPVDGTIVEGSSELDESALTGESKPAQRGPEEKVIAGSVNGSGALTVEVTGSGDESYLSRVMGLVEEAQQSRSRAQDLANRAAFWLTVIALSAGAVTFIAWWLTGHEVVFALQRTITVMVITCPHALGLAVPLVVAVSTAKSASSGLLIRDRTAFERLRDVETVVFDKTGTLTDGRFEVSDIIALSGEGDEGADRVLAVAAAVEASSEHPIAAAIVERAEKASISVPSANDFEAISGRGARATVDGDEVRVLSANGLEAEGVAPEQPDERVQTAQEDGKTLAFVTVGGELIGALVLEDRVRDVSKKAVQQLQEKGIEVRMLTGDAVSVADRVARELGIDDVQAEVLPEDKADAVQRVRDDGGIVAMVGDGVNDAPALATADIGVAIGAGTDVAIEAADIVLVRNDPRDVVTAVGFAQTTHRKTVQNLIWATGYNVIAIPLAAGVLAAWGVLLSPAVGALLMSVSTVIVAINAKLTPSPAEGSAA